MPTFTKRSALVAVSISLAAGCYAAGDDPQDASELAETSEALTNGTTVPTGAWEAVGRVPGCTATLIDHQVVLTAAHCVCPDSSPVGCDARTTFSLKNVRPVDNPGTQVDESATRADVRIPGTVHVHPSFGAAGWLRMDYAVISLDYPAFQVALDVVPMPIGGVGRKPSVGDTLKIIGYGLGGEDCSQASGVKRIATVKPDEVVPEAIRFRPPATCPGDSGGPLLDRTFTHVIATTSWGDGGTSTVRPVYEVFNWVQGYVNQTPQNVRFEYSEGRSRDLDAYQELDAYWQSVGIVGMDIASDDRVYTWYNNGTLTIGTPNDLTSANDGAPYALPAGKTPADIVDIAIASDDVVYTWYKDGTVSKGHSWDLDAISAPAAYTLRAGKRPTDIVGIAIAKSTDIVYTWYADGMVSQGHSWALASLGSPYSFAAASGKTPADIVAMGIGSNDHVFTWYRFPGDH